jgi:hypothetical protein
MTTFNNDENIIKEIIKIKSDNKENESISK